MCAFKCVIPLYTNTHTNTHARARLFTHIHTHTFVLHIFAVVAHYFIKLQFNVCIYTYSLQGLHKRIYISVFINTCM